MSRFLTQFSKFILLVLLAFLVTACGGVDQTPPLLETDNLTELVDTVSPTEAVTLVAPTATPEPAAAVVNGERITLAEYQAELDRYRDAVGRDLNTDDAGVVLNDLVSLVLLAQAASENGFNFGEDELDARLTNLIADTGGESAFNNWLVRNHYNSGSFRAALTRSMLPGA